MAAISALRAALAHTQRNLALRAARPGALAQLCGRAAQLLGALAGVAAVPHAGAIELPENRADILYHRWDGGGVTADGPALLVRTSLLDRVSLVWGEQPGEPAKGSSKPLPHSPSLQP